MSLSGAAFRASVGMQPVGAAAARALTARRRVGIIWGLLFLNALGSGGTIVHLPSIVIKGITQGSLIIALLMALALNRKVLIRPNVFLCLVSLLPMEAILTALEPQALGTIYRTFRLTEFVTVLWLLTPWWGRRDLLLVRSHLAALAVILTSVVLGLLIRPGTAYSGGRLGGVVWEIPPTQLAHYAAVTVGLVVVLWLCHQVPGRTTLAIVVAAGTILLFTRTRTALLGMVAGILVAGLSLIVTRERVRRFFAIIGVIAAIAIITLSSVITTYLARGEGTQELTNLTGRTKVWGPLLATPRTGFEEIFGFGLSNSSFNGLPIDSNWFSSYQEQGLFGVTVCALLLLFLLVAAYFQPGGVQRALALFLIVYCLIASFTEDGFTDATPYLLELALAASLLVAPTVTGRFRQQDRAGPQLDLPTFEASPAGISTGRERSREV